MPDETQPKRTIPYAFAMVIVGTLIVTQAFPDMSIGPVLSLVVGLHVIAAGYALALGKQS